MTDAQVSDDRAAVAWAVYAAQTKAGKVVTERMSRGEEPAVSDVLLTAIHAEWEEAGRPVVQPHTHRDEVTFADGTTIVATRFLVDAPYDREEAPDFGLYLDQRWAPPWDHAHLLWASYVAPDPTELRVALEDLLARSRRGEHVEVGCLGGHGRTGTALACLAVMTGTPSSEAVTWVHSEYCEKAVETDEQRAFVAAFPQQLNRDA